MSECIEMARHCIGLDRKKPYTRHGRKFYRPYRNYFTCSKTGNDREGWEAMCAAGYANKGACERRTLFYLTREGLEWLGKELGITIHGESN